MIKDRYFRKKQELLQDNDINLNNRKVMDKFLEHQEYRLKRKNSLSEVDERSYKTLCYYIGRLIKLNQWFNNRDWTTLKKSDIKKLIDDLEDGVIKTKTNQRFSDRSLYYQMLQGKLFALIKKDNYAQEIIKEHEINGRQDNIQVRFITEENFRKIVDCAISPEQRCLLWLAFDIGENINSLLALEKKDFRKQINEDTKEPEYLVILSKENLKRSRTPRSEITNYQDTVKYLDIVLSNLKPSEKVISNKFMKDKNMSELHRDDKLFKFGQTAATLFLNRCVQKSGVTCEPLGQKTTWKDLRSSMSCDLLKKGWSRDEVNARLGHTPSSRIIDRYINFLALDRNKPKKKVYESNIRNLEYELENSKELSKLQALRIKQSQDDIILLQRKLDMFMKSNEYVQELLEREKQDRQLDNDFMSGKKLNTKDYSELFTKNK
ncbi:MAG: hypothetical protein AABX10_03120 [Nanoarchaeota archaeon]